MSIRERSRKEPAAKFKPEARGSAEEAAALEAQRAEEARWASLGLPELIAEMKEKLASGGSRPLMSFSSTSSNGGKKEESKKELTDALYSRPPDSLLPKPFWNALGDELVKREKLSWLAEEEGRRGRGCVVGEIGGEKWFTLRLDGHGFSKFVKVLRKAGIPGIPPHGFSPKFGKIMATCCKSLMSDFLPGSCRFGYTQSDEISIVVSQKALVPEREAKEPGERFTHEFNGRVQKIASLAAAHATSVFNYELMKACGACKDEDVDEGGEEKAVKPVPFTAALLATFDCRIGVFDSEEEALALLLWRSFDCAVNGVSDRIHHLQFDEAKMQELAKNSPEGEPEDANEWRKAIYKPLVLKSVQKKLEFLLERDLLPLPAHQAYGTFFQSVKRVKRGVDPRTGQPAPVTKLKKNVEALELEVPRCLLALYAEGKLVTEDEELPPAEEAEPPVEEAEPAGV